MLHLEAAMCSLQFCVPPTPYMKENHYSVTGLGEFCGPEQFDVSTTREKPQAA